MPYPVTIHLNFSVAFSTIIRVLYKNTGKNVTVAQTVSEKLFNVTVNTLHYLYGYKILDYML